MLFLFIQLKMAIPRCPSSRADLDFCNLKERVPVRTDKWFWIKKLIFLFRLTESDKNIFFTNFLISGRPAPAS